MSNYNDCLANLNSFYNNLATTGIKFLYFYASDLTKPKVKDIFRKYEFHANTYYITQGQTSNFLYIYIENQIKYIIASMKPTHRHNEHNAVIKQRNNVAGDTFLGDHLDFSIINQRSGNVLVKCHKTTYDDITGNYNFSRSENTCNFTLDSRKIGNVNAFSSRTRCEDKSGITNRNLKITINNSTELDIIYNLCKIVLGITTFGGNLPNKTGQVHYGKRGGRYIMKNNRKYYIQSGGAEYKGITFFTDKFTRYLSEKIIKPLYDIRPDLVGITIMFDEFNELDDEANKHIIFIYDFLEHDMNTFSIDSKITMVACYSEYEIREGRSNVLTELERDCHNQIETIVEQFSKSHLRIS